MHLIINFFYGSQIVKNNEKIRETNLDFSIKIISPIIDIDRYFENERKKIFPIIYKSNHKLEDVMTTFSNHIAYQLIKNIDGKKNKILVTGGGVYNDFLVEKIKVYDKNKNLWIIPDNKLIKYKEALIFAFMGLLKKLNKQNILNTVTGSNIKISAGNISKNIL